MMDEQKTEDGSGAEKSKWKLWLKRLGFWGFMFFLVKGLVWIGIFVYGYFWATKK